MARRVHLDIGINGAFLTRRWEQPDSFMRLTREVGYEYHEFCADVLDPFFSGGREYQLAAAREIRDAAQRHGVTITDIYTGVATHRFHGLSHSNAVVRERMVDWVVDCMDLALAMGTDRIGGHWDAISVETLGDPARTEWALRNLHRTFRRLALTAAEKGLAAIYNEQMYVPSEVPWTLDQAQEFLIEVNRPDVGQAPPPVHGTTARPLAAVAVACDLATEGPDESGFGNGNATRRAPVYLTVDVGHMAGEHYGLSGADTDYAAWLERFGAFAEIVHLQQTTRDASHHWPFTPEYNERGHVRIERVLAAIERSHAKAADAAVAEVLAPVATTYLIAEIIPGSTKTEERLLDELAQSAQYLRQFVPAGGVELTF
ncbi:MAG TPA: TIM barrel protein [Armatimonadota bacterium]|nr:TIM barrel protein [Armatimonadota bacterium]